MISSQEFNPFNILPRDLMLYILLHTFTDEGQGSLEVILDYQKADEDLRVILSDEKNLKYIFDSMPTEFNIRLYPTLRRRKITTDEGRYRAGLALLFLKYLYEHVKPFPDDEFITKRYNDYYSSLQYLQEYFTDYPMPMYVGAYVAFYIAKRLMSLNPLDQDLREKGAKIYKISVHCIVRAHELEHPLAQIFYSDMASQLQRGDIDINDYITEKLPEIPDHSLNYLLSVLSEKLTIDISAFTDEMQTLLLVTWRKLILENYYNACELFDYTFQNDKLTNITEFIYSCYEINHFHRRFLAHNPLFMHVAHKENSLYLLQTFSVDTLVTLHQGFLVSHPNTDSVLLSTMLTMRKEELKDFRALVIDILNFPQTNSSGWRICFHEAYRNAVDDGSLKVVSSKQMKMVLTYFILVDQAAKIECILERDAEIVDCIFHCNNDKLHDIAMAVIKQLMDFNSVNQLGQLDHQEIILRVIYQDAAHLSMADIQESHDLNRIAAIIVNTYATMIAPNISSHPEFKVYDYMFKNRSKFRDLLHAIHSKLIESGNLRAA